MSIEAATSATFGLIDILTLLAYAVAVAFIAFFSGSPASSSSSPGGNTSVSSYFGADRSIAWWAVALSLFSSNVGAEHFIGLAGWGCSGGIAVSLMEMCGVFSLACLAYIFLPLYWKANVQTLPEYIEMRYSSLIKSILIACALVTYVFTKVGATLYATTLLLDELTSLSYWGSYLVALALTLFTAIYTMFGGLSSVIYTDVLQTIVLFAGSLILFILGLSEIIVQPETFWDNKTIVESTPEFFHLINTPHLTGGSSMSWTAILFGYIILGVRFWCCDQVIVQRALAAKSLSEGRLGCCVTGLLKLLPMALMVIPGMMARFFMMQGGITDISGQGASVDVCDQAYPFLIRRLLTGTGLSGLMFAAIFSAMMSSLSSVFNSAATIFTLDIYRRLYSTASERSLVFVGRVVVLVLALVSLLWLILIPLFRQSLLIYIQEISSYQAPLIFCLFLFGAFWPSANEKGALATIFAGTLFGFFKFCANFSVSVMSVKTPFLFFIAEFNFMHYSAVNFLVCVVTMLATSKCFPETSSRKLEVLMLQRGDVFGDLVQTDSDVEMDMIHSVPKPKQRNDVHHVFEMAAVLCLSSGIILFVVILVIFR